jgi:hypothetical protein
MTTLLDVYKWHLEDRDRLADMASMFSEEVGLDEEQTEELFEIILEDNLTSFEFEQIIYENYRLCLTLILEETNTKDLIRKVKIERERKKLGRQFRKVKGDTPEQSINKSVQSLATFKLTKDGKFEQRKTQGDVAKIRSNLQSKRSKFLSSQGKVAAAKATEKRKRQSRVGRKTGASKFVSKLVK